jgi:hypothetical protein
MHWPTVTGRVVAAAEGDRAGAQQARVGSLKTAKSLNARAAVPITRRGKREAYAPQAPGAACGPQKSPSPLTAITSVLGSRVKVIMPVGVSFGSVVFVTTPTATSPDEEVRCPLAMSPPVMMLLEILSQGGGP